MRACIDSDVLIWHLRGDTRALKFLKSLRETGVYEFWTGAMQRAEVVFVMRPEEVEPTRLFLAQFKTAPVDQAIVDRAGDLYRKWNPSHGTDVNDALLAATVLLHGGHLFSLNGKHYPMPEVAIKQAW